MATCKPLYIGDRPVIVSFPYWLYSDAAIGGAFDALKRAAGPLMLTVRDPSLMVGILRADALDDPAVARAQAALVDELTVWRLASHDGRRHAGHGLGRSDSAKLARHAARLRGAA